MANETLRLRKGLLENLAAAPYIEGALSFTTDEPAIYLDVNNEHLRIGDIKQFDTMAQFEAYVASYDADKLPTSALYYIIGGEGDSYTNALLKWTGTKWIQINEKSDFSGDIESLENSIKTITEDVAKKANSADVYTKTEADGLLNAKANAVDVYSKTEADGLLNAKANSADVYSKTDIDSKVSAINTEVGKKANSADVYSKTEADTLLAAKANAANVYTKTEADELLNSKANADNVYSKNEIDSKVSEINTEVGKKANSADVYSKTEVDNLVGTKANSTDVYTKTETDGLLSNKANSADVYSKTDIDNKVSEINTEVGKKANSADVYTKTEADDLLSNKANSADVYTKTEADGLLNAKANAADVYTKGEIDNKVTNINNSVNAVNEKIGSAAQGETASTGLYKYIDDSDAASLAAAKKYVDDELSAKLAAADAMKFKGIVESADELPSEGVEAGWTYKVGENFTLNGTKVYVGDLIIAVSDQDPDSSEYSDWAHVASGWEDDHDVHVALSDNKIAIVNAAGAARGSIEITGNYTEAAGGAKVTVATTSIDPASGITDVSVNVEMLWGSF